MSEFQAALLIGALITAIISRKLPHAWLWIRVGALSFIASTAYSRYGLPYPPAFTLACDAAVCLAVYHKAVEMWEVYFYKVFRASCLISLLYLFGFVGSHWTFVVALELCNWAALLLIGGTAILAGNAGGNHSVASWVGRVHSFRSALRAPRSESPWHKVAR